MDVQDTSVRNLLYVGGAGYVKAFDCSSTPRLVWTTNLEGTGYHIVSLLGDLNQIYAGTNGYIFRLDGKTGKVVWTKKLSSMICFVTLAMNGAHLVAGCHGYVYTLDKETGNVVWEKSLEKAGYVSVNLCVIPNHILATCGGRLFCLAPLNGNQIWTNPLDGCGLQGTSLSFNPNSNVIHTGVRGFVDTISASGATLAHVSLADTGYQPVDQVWVGGIFIVCTVDQLIRLDPMSGNTIWRKQIPASALNVPTLKAYKNDLWVGSAEHITCYDPENGSVKQILSLPSEISIRERFLNFVVINDFFFCSLLGKIHQIDRTSGKIVWSDELEGMGYDAHFLATFDQYQDLNRGGLFAQMEMRQQRSNGGLLSLLYT